MNLGGIIVGAVSFLIIGISTPLIIKAEYYIGKKVWPVFLVAGVAILIATLWVSHPVWSPILGVTAAPASGASGSSSSRRNGCRRLVPQAGGEGRGRESRPNEGGN